MELDALLAAAQRAPLARAGAGSSCSSRPSGSTPTCPSASPGWSLHALVAALLFAYTRKRVGDLLALAAAAVVLFLGTAWPDVLWPFQIGFLSSLAAGIGALLALDREDRRGDVIAAVLLGVALASSSLGLPLLAAAALEVLGRPDRRSRWWIVAAPAVLYARLVPRLRRRGDGDLGQPVRLARPTSPTRPRAPRARCSRSARIGAARSSWPGIVALLSQPPPARDGVVAAARADRGCRSRSGA